MMVRFHTVGNYRLTGRRLGEGNFSKVYQANHTILGASVALKVIGESKLQEDYVRKNLKREERLLAKLDHPCIVRLFETMQYRNIYCIVMEEVRGTSLHQFVATNPNGIKEAQGLVIAIQLFSAVDHMHSRRVVHRDLKMENVIYDRLTRRVKVVDFGLGNEWFGGRQGLTTQCGSPEYAAPELYTPGRIYGPEVDLWSLGIILYAMATGKLPFRFRRGRVKNPNDRLQFLSQLTKGLTELHLKSVRSYSPQFSSLLLSLLRPNPHERLTMGKALVHPWLQRAKRIWRPKSLPNAGVSSFVEQVVVDQLARMLAYSPKQVLAEIRKNPYGKVGGVFNLMCWLKKR